MTIDSPVPAQIPALRALWKQAFGDTDAFLDSFFSLGYAPERCRCLTIGNSIASALYWFDASCDGQKIAYLYAVATDEAFRNQGLCRALMEDTHTHLYQSGYDAAMLVPGSRELFGFYEKLGYRTATHIRQFSCTASGQPVPLRPIDAKEYAALRRQLLPPGSVLQEGPTLFFLEAQAHFYASNGLSLVATLEDGVLRCAELLGAPEAAPGILAALGAKQGIFRTPGSDIPFAMYHSLTDPGRHFSTYLGLALD